jgi:hypothetical protein
MRARVAVAHMDSNGRRVEAKSGVKSLQSLLQAGVRAQKILERGSDVDKAGGRGRVSQKPGTSGSETEEHPIQINQGGPSATVGRGGARYRAKRWSCRHCCCAGSRGATKGMRFR